MEQLWLDTFGSASKMVTPSSEVKAEPFAPFRTGVPAEEMIIPPRSALAANLAKTGSYEARMKAEAKAKQPALSPAATSAPKTSEIPWIEHLWLGKFGPVSMLHFSTFAPKHQIYMYFYLQSHTHSHTHIYISYTTQHKHNSTKYKRTGRCRHRPHCRPNTSPHRSERNSAAII
jgi:hypothetical protein